jgi:mannitol 2-dehydrogenase
MPRPLNLSSLASLPSAVARPAYRRTDLRAGILHIGVGNFHRAHQAVYLDDLFNAGRDRGWAILGAGVRASDRAMRQALEPQDWLTTVVELEPGKARARRRVDGGLPAGPGGRARHRRGPR